jgi:hypothetical protein
VVLDVDHLDERSVSGRIGRLDLGRLDGRRVVWFVSRLDGERVIRDARGLDLWRLDGRWVVLGSQPAREAVISSSLSSELNIQACHRS